MDLSKYLPAFLYALGTIAAGGSILFVFWVNKMIVEPMKAQADAIKEHCLILDEIKSELFNLWKEKADGSETKTRLKELDGRVYDLATPPWKVPQ